MIKVAVDGGQPPVGGGAGAAQVLGEELKVVQQPPHLLAELAGKAVHLLGGEGGVRGGAEQEQHPSGGRDLGKDEQAAAAGESSRSLNAVQRGRQVLGRLGPHGQLWQVTEGGGVERGDLSVPHLHRRLGELLQKALFFRHPDPPFRSKTGAALPQ